MIENNWMTSHDSNLCLKTRAEVGLHSIKEVAPHSVRRNCQSTSDCLSADHVSVDGNIATHHYWLIVNRSWPVVSRVDKNYEIIMISRSDTECKTLHEGVAQCPRCISSVWDVYSPQRATGKCASDRKTHTHTHTNPFCLIGLVNKC